MSKIKQFEEKQLDPKDYEKEEKIAKWVRGFFAAGGVALSFFAAKFFRNKNGGNKA